MNKPQIRIFAKKPEILVRPRYRPFHNCIEYILEFCIDVDGSIYRSIYNRNILIK